MWLSVVGHASLGTAKCLMSINIPMKDTGTTIIAGIMAATLTPKGHGVTQQTLTLSGSIVLSLIVQSKIRGMIAGAWYWSKRNTEAQSMWLPVASLANRRGTVKIRTTTSSHRKTISVPAWRKRSVVTQMDLSEPGATHRTLISFGTTAMCQPAKPIPQTPPRWTLWRSNVFGWPLAQYKFYSVLVHTISIFSSSQRAMLLAWCTLIQNHKKSIKRPIYLQLIINHSVCCCHQCTY